MSRIPLASLPVLLCLLLAMGLWSTSAQAACSARMGQATLNEVYRGTGSGGGRFMEVRLLQNLPVAVWGSWTARVCVGGGPACTTVNLSGAAQSADGFYLVFAKGLNNNYYDFDGMDVALLDASGDAIDYVSIDNYSTQRAGLSCSDFPYPTATGNVGNTFNVHRVPDGTGAWVFRPGNSYGDSEGSSNDDSVPVAGPHHIRLLHDGQGLTCAPETVTVQACTDAACSSLYPDAVQVSLGSSPAGGVWSPNPVTLTGGSATVQLRKTTPGTITLQTTATDPLAQSATRCFAGGVETCAMTFNTSGFVFDFDAVQPILAGRSATPVVVSALAADPADPSSCAPAFSGPRSVGLWFDYAEPTGGTRQLAVNGTVLGTASPGTPVTLDFDANARASIALLYNDAGLLNLNARYEGSGEEAGLVMTGSGQFVVRPAGLCVDSPAASADCDPASPACSVLRRAGEAFPLRISAVAWRADDGGNLCLDRAARVTPNFRHGDIPLAATLVAPLPGEPGSLAVNTVAMGATDGGVVQVDQEVSEVGVFRVAATPAPGSYLGVDVAGGTSANLGRFTPYDFDVALENTPSYAPACDGAFTYLSQWFGYEEAPRVRIQARNRYGAVTRNYDGTWWRLPDVSPDYTHAGMPDPLPASVTLVSDASHDAIDCSAGGCQGEVVVAFAGEFTYERDGVPVDPVNGRVQIQFAVQDDDGVAFDTNPFEFVVGFDGGEDEQRWGRLEMGNAHGPELLPLTVPLYTSYFQDGGFRINLEDSCTVLDASHLNPDIQLSGGTTTASVLSNPAVAGRLNVSLTAPGAGNTGYVDLRPDLSVTTGADLPWLLFDWDGDGSERGPEARATFGVFGGNERQIYIRELP